jgi:hypothetical protein
MMEFFIALISADPAHLAMGVFAVVGICGIAGGESVEEDDNSDYENASWNPSSVNYNE